MNKSEDFWIGFLCGVVMLLMLVSTIREICDTVTDARYQRLNHDQKAEFMDWRAWQR